MTPENGDSWKRKQAAAIASAMVRSGGRRAIERASQRAPAASKADLVVQAAVHPSGELTLRREVEVTRSALLYADHVRLISANAAMLFVIKDLDLLSVDDRLTAFEQMIPVLQPELLGKMLLGKVREMRTLLGKRRLANQELLARERLRREFEQQWEKVCEEGKRQWHEAGGEELDKAYNAGLLSFALVAEAVDDMGSVIDGFVAELSHAMTQASAAPLFDDQTGDLIRLGIAGNQFTVPELAQRKAVKAGIASGLVGRLPAFPAAAMEQVVEARAELSNQIPGFRQVVACLAGRVESHAYDVEFPEEVADLYREEVEPAFQEIEGQLTKGRVLEMLQTGMTTGTAPVITYIVSTTTGLPSAAVAALTGTSMVGATAISWLRQRSERDAAARRNGFYLLYGANQAWEKQS